MNILKKLFKKSYDIIYACKSILHAKVSGGPMGRVVTSFNICLYGIET